VLELDGIDMRTLPLQAQRLVRLMAKAPNGQVLAEMSDYCRALFRPVCAMGLGGAVSKRLDSPYRSGRAPTSLNSAHAISRQGYSRSLASPILSKWRWTH
jgi:bifunctional non-homologous end joining protein LigD